MATAAEILGLQLPQAGPVVSPGGPATQALSEQDPTLQALAQPAKSQEEIAQRVQGWQAVLAKVQQDPNLMRAIGLAGAYLMQPIPQGQTSLGHAGRAFVFGNTAYGFGQRAQDAQALSQREQARKEAESQAVVSNREADTKRVEMLTPLEADKARKALKEADARIAAASTQQQRDAETLRKTQLETKLMERFGEERYRTEIAQGRAAADASAATTRLRNTEARGKEFDNELKALEAKVANGTATAEEKARHTELTQLSRKSGTPVSAQVQSMEYLLQLRKQAHPEETDQQRAEWLLQYHQTSKTDPLAQAAKLEELAAYETDPARRAELLRMADSLRQQNPNVRGGEPPPLQPGVVPRIKLGEDPNGKPIIVR